MAVTGVAREAEGALPVTLGGCNTGGQVAVTWGWSWWVVWLIHGVVVRGSMGGGVADTWGGRRGFTEALWVLSGIHGRYMRAD